MSKERVAGPESRSSIDFLVGGGDMSERIRCFDWTRHPLGPVEGWAQSLKTAVSLILSSRHPMWIGWGEEMSFLYNDAYLHVLGPAKHPWALGRPASAVWREIWDICGPLADKVMRAGEAAFVDDVRLFMDRGDYLEETFYSFSYSPIRGEMGKVLGLFCPSTDVTPKVLSARRLRTLSELAASSLVEKTIDAACSSAAATLARNPDDVPFALLYLVDHERRQVMLRQSIGIAGGGEVSPRSLPLDPGAGRIWPIGEVLRTSRSRSVSLQDTGDFPAGLAGQRPSQALVLPVAARAEEQPFGVIVAGVSPARKLDEDYLAFFELVSSHVATAIQNAMAAEEDRKRAEMLAEVDRAKTAFFSNVSHEFRTPLTLMLGPVEDMLAKPEDSVPPENRQNLELVHRHSLRLLKLVNALLDFSRIEAGRMQAIYERTDLASFTGELASVFRSAVERAGLRFKVDCEAVDAEVYVDRDMWEKIVLNLMSNALKFTFEGEIEVLLRQTGNMVELAVRDTGVGIPPEELPRVFERFHRVESGLRRSHEGTGIGLALVAELAKLHGGSVRAESEIGVGTTFTVSIPSGSAHLPAERIGGARPHLSMSTAPRLYVEEAVRWLPDAGDSESAALDLIGSGELPDSDLESGGNRPRVVLADDNSDMREYVRRLLSERFAVEAVANGKAALEAIRRAPPDLILSDVMMPEMDGFELLHQIRSDADLREIPFLMLSARAGEEARIEGVQAGADDYLVKPFSARELVARVGTHIQLAQQRRLAARALRESEERYRAVVESQAEMVSRFRPDGAILFANGAYARACGLTPDAIEGRSFWDFVPAEDRPALREVLDRLTPEAPEVRVENRFQTADGVRWTLWTNRALAFDANGRVTEAQSTGIDITDRKRFEEALRESEARFRALVDSLDAIVWDADPETLQFTYVSRRAEQLLGYPRERWLEPGFWMEVLHPDDRAIAANLGAGALPRKSDQDFEYRVIAADGRVVWLHNRVYVSIDEQGRPRKLSGVMTDTTRRKRAEEELQRSHMRLQADAEELARFNRNMVGRELRMIELKKEVNQLCYRLGEVARYGLVLEPHLSGSAETKSGRNVSTTEASN